MVVTRCSIVTGGDRHRATIDAVIDSIIEPSACVAGVLVEAFAFDAYACIPSNDIKDISGLVSPPSDVIGPFPFIFDV